MYRPFRSYYGHKGVILLNAIIMAGGEGTRLKQIWPDAPKPMIPVLGKPVMEWLLGWLRHNGVSRVRAALRYKPGVITDYFGSGGAFQTEMSYHVEGAPLGTAGSVRACADFYGSRDFFVLSGDAVCDFDLRSRAEYHRRSHAAVTMALYGCDSPTGYGLVIREPGGRVRGFIEKPGWDRVVTDQVNTGVYVVSPRAMDYVPEGQPFDFAADLFPRLLAAGETVMALRMEGYWNDIGTPRAYYRSCLDALEGRVRLYGPDGKPVQTPAPEEAPARPVPEEKECTEVPCVSRAKLMGLLTERFLFEAGTDFSDGLRLPDVHIAPALDKNALLIRGDDPEKRADWAKIIRSFGEFV